MRVSDVGIVANHLSPELDVLAKQVKAAGKKLSDESEQQDFISAHDRLTSLASELETWRTQSQSGTVYWLESYETRRGRPRMTLAGSPVDIGAAMREQLFDKVPSVIMTSATLSVGRSRGEQGSPAKYGSGGDKASPFAFFKSRVGVTQCAELQVGSPFDYREQAELVTLRDMPDPTKRNVANTKSDVSRRFSIMRG